MGETAPNNEVVEMSDYLADTLVRADEAIRDMHAHRQDLAVRKAVIDAARDPELQRVADEVQALLDAGETIPARPAEQVLAEAHRRYVG